MIFEYQDTGYKAKGLMSQSLTYIKVQNLPELNSHAFY